uniref:DUF4283 domain-containing protein n=1 Tax=Cannabis sativa TaxID=3483 RepID=A0A803NKP7_CANSA
MAKTRSKVQGRQPTSMKTRKIRKKGPVSTADAKKTKSMDERLYLQNPHFTRSKGKKKLDLTSPLSWRQMLNVKVTSHKEKVKITDEDIEEEVNLWNSIIVCYVLGANPPLSIIDGFARRVWKDRIDKVGMISYGVFLIRFYTIEDRDNVLNGGYIFFNKRPVVMKPWNSDGNFKKENLNVIPIWVQLENLELKYWGERSLFKIIGQLGKPIMVDSITKERDEHGYNTSVGVNYEWKTVFCEHCKGMGHKAIECRKRQPVQKGWRPKETQQPEMTETDNSYQILEEADMEAINETINEKDASGKRKKSTNSCGVEIMDGNHQFALSFVYAYNDEEGRKALWKDLQQVAQPEPWAMENQSWMGKFTNAGVNFMNEELMDHTPAVMTFHNMVPSGKKPFRYFRMWNTHSDYAARVVASWNQQTQGLKMFQVVTKLKRLKGVLKELNKQAFSDIQMSTQQAKDTLAEMQNKLHQDPLNQMLQQEELAARKDYTALLKNYQTYLQQKAKVTWLKNGDKNTALFHASIKARRRQNRVFSIQNQDGERLEEEAKISEAFLSYYKGLLGTKMQGRRTVITSLAQSGAVLSDQLASWLCQDYSCGEIKVVVFAILGIKAPGPDGYSSYFFQDNWELIQGDVCAEVQNFLHSGLILKEINFTVLTLIQKLNAQILLASSLRHRGLGSFGMVASSAVEVHEVRIGIPFGCGLSQMQWNCNGHSKIWSELVDGVEI